MVLSCAQGYGWSPAKGQIEQSLDIVLPHQTPAGNFGVAGSYGSDDARIPSGNGFALEGIMAAWRDTGDARCLASARRLAHYFEILAPTWETRSHGLLHEFYGHCIPGLVALYEATGDAMPLDLARRLAAHAGCTHHTHHTLSECRGLVELARVTGDAKYLAPVKDYLAWCRESQLADGALPESMPSSEQDEGCGLADYVVVNLLMFRVTGEGRHLDEAEHMLVNHFAMNQFHTGGFGHRTFGHEIVGGKFWQGWNGRYGSENPGCCSFWGAYALATVGQYIVTRQDGDVPVNLYLPPTSISATARDWSCGATIRA